METLYPAALLQRGDNREQQQRTMQRVPLGQLDRSGSAANVLSSPGADARRTLKVRGLGRKRDTGRKEREK
jgi:hypothetical protein